VTRLLKIKAYTLFLAWGLIFLHNIIPHTHIEEQPHYCHSLFHKITAVHHHHGHETEVSGEGEHQDHDTVCHYTALFTSSHAAADFVAAVPSSDNTVTIPEYSESLYIPGTGNHSDPPGKGSLHLRAPPLS